jgi:hypothetical protein
MVMLSPLDSASARLWWSNAAYVSGAALTFLAAMIVFIERRLIAKGIREKSLLVTEFVAVGAAIVSFFGTVGAIHYSNLVSHLKDLDLAVYETSAGIQIAQAQKAGADATKSAADANLKNTQLQIELASHETSESKIQADLAKQNKATSDFAHSLAQQQATMAEQAHLSPVLTDFQIQQLAAVLGGFSGQDVILHSTADTTVLRLKQTIAIAFQKAGITFKQNSMDMGALYQGVSVAVHNPQDVPPLANALVLGLRQAGIDVHPVAVPNMVPAGSVALFLGPD